MLLFGLTLLSLPAAGQTPEVKNLADSVEKQIAARAREQEPLVVAYFSASWCPPCREFKRVYLNHFAQTCQDRYKGKVVLREFDITDKKSRDFEAFVATTAAYAQKSMSIPVAVVGDTYLPGPDAAPLEAAIDKALKNGEKTRLFYTPQTDLAPDNLVEAVQQGNYAAAKSFLQNGGNVNATDIYGNSLLMLAAFYGHEDVTALLLAYRPDVNYKTSWGYTAALNAAFTGQENILRLLADHGADLSVETPSGENMLGAAAKGLQQNMLRLLVKQYGLDLNAPLKKGGSILQWAVSQRNEIAVAKALIDAGAGLHYPVSMQELLDGAQTPEMKAFLITQTAK